MVTARNFVNQKRMFLGALALLVLAAIVFVPSAYATHFTSIALGPAQVVVVPGGTASFTGVVDGATDAPGCEYGATLVASAPGLGATTLTPDSKPMGAPTLMNYALDVVVPIGTAAGVYPVEVTATWTEPGGCSLDPPTRTASAEVVVLAGACVRGDGWVLEAAPAGDLFDANGDGYICTKALPIGSSGEGNSANSQRGDGQTGYHVDGHNHKDNNN